MTGRWLPHQHKRYAVERPRKMLSIDGGGLRGLLSLEILRAIETMLATRTGHGKDFRLSHYFDYIAGTSTGSVIATLLALGKTVEEAVVLYMELGPQAFADKPPEERPISRFLKETFGDRDLTSEDLQCLVMLVMHNNTTDSAWPLSSNPLAKYNNPENDDCNLRIPLWKLVRGSTAYPGVFTPAKVTLGDREHQFDDGGVSPFINPAFQLYKMATAPEYNLRWKTGERDLLLISIGTGTAPNANAEVYNPTQIADVSNFLSQVMYGAQVEQDANCRTIGRCTYGEPLDGEVGDMIPREDGEPIPLTRDLGRHFLYVRYDVQLEQARLNGLGLDDIEAHKVQGMGAADQLINLRRIGERIGQEVAPDHFGSFLEDYSELRSRAAG